MNIWNPRNEILAATHRWYWVVFSFFLGALLGWLVSVVWPAPYRAVQDIYVGLNAHRATRDLYIAEVGLQQFRNLDDYKNWQMEQLNALAMSDAYLEETLIRLKEEDDSWQSMDIPMLREMLGIAWRNTGDWHFSAEAENPALAVMAVSVWSQVVTEEVDFATEAAREMVTKDIMMKELSAKTAELAARKALLQETQSALKAWQDSIGEKSAGQPLDLLTHWHLYTLVSIAASWNIGWQTVLDEVPPVGSVANEYLNWISQVIILIQSELTTMPRQIETLNREFEALEEEYATFSEDSRGLSDNLKVEPIKLTSPEITRIRPTGTLILAGGVLGLLVWGIIWLVTITRRSAG